MNDAMQRLGGQIALQKDELAEAIVDDQWSRNPSFNQRYGQSGHTKWVEDVTFNLASLSEAVSVGSHLLFEAYIDWIKIRFEGLGIPIEDLNQSLEICREVLGHRFPESNKLLRTYINGGIKHLAQGALEPKSFFDDSQPLGKMARQYLGFLRAGQRSEASHLILSAAESGVDVRDIYLNVLQPSQRETGRLWQMNQLSVAEEHYCTAATQLIMSQLSSHIFGTKRIGKCLVATCVGGELHEIGLRMVADFFEMAGWDTYYLGSNTPSASIVQALLARKADVLLVSATMTSHVALVEDLIKNVRAEEALSKVKILVGGYPFNIDPELWRQIGADGTASSALDAIPAAKALLA